MNNHYPLSQIKRTKTLEGTMIYAVINNGGSYFVIDLPIYEDGVFDCWQEVDVEGLKEKLRSGWLTHQIPNENHFSIHHLGSWTVQNANWEHTRDNYFAFLLSIVKRMNPEMQNIFQSHGIGSKVIGNSNYSIYSAGSRYGNQELQRRDAEVPSFINFNGNRQHYFYKHQDTYHLASLDIYNDATILINGIPSHLICNPAQIKTFADQGILATELPPGAKVSIKDLGTFEVQNTRYATNLHDKISEITDIIARLNKQPTSSDICYNLYQEYGANPIPELQQKLKEAYERVPQHLRTYILGDMDMKDFPIRAIIY